MSCVTSFRVSLKEVCFHCFNELSSWPLTHPPGAEERQLKRIKVTAGIYDHCIYLWIGCELTAGPKMWVEI